nr:hypothetical protein [Candidatus Sigynarchaeum springense]
MVESELRDSEVFWVDADDMHMQHHVRMPKPCLTHVLLSRPGEFIRIPAHPLLDITKGAKEQQRMRALLVPLRLVRGAAGNENLSGCSGNVKKDSVGVPVFFSSFTNVGA